MIKAIVLAAGIIVIILANLFLLAAVFLASKNKKDIASKVGFCFLKILTIANILTAGGYVVWIL